MLHLWLTAVVWQRQFSSAFSDPLLIPDYAHRARGKSRDEMTSSQVLVADAASEGVDTLWIVAPVCVAVVFILVLALIIVLTRYRNNLEIIRKMPTFSQWHIAGFNVTVYVRLCNPVHYKYWVLGAILLSLPNSKVLSGLKIDIILYYIWHCSI